MNNNNTSIYSSIDNYWQRRQNETQNKLNNIRNEEFQKEQCELQKKPKISKNSIKIAKKLRQNTINNNNNNNNEDVFSRLTNKNYIEKHNEEIKRLSELNNKNHSPNINESSKLMKRTIEDLYTWQNFINHKKNEAKNYIDSQENKTNLYTNLKSDKILMNRKPDYINKKVEDRLLEQGEINKMKLEEQKEHYIENVTAKCLYNNNNYNNKNSYNQIKSRYLNLDNYKIIPSKRKDNKNNIKNNNKKIKSVRNRKKNINLYNFEEEKLNKTQENIKLNINRIRNPRHKSDPNLPVFGNKTQQEIINIREQTALKANKFINNYNNNNANYNNNLYKINNLTTLENSNSLNLITTSESHKTYDIKFKPTSSKRVITTNIENPNNVDINTFEKDAHLIQKKLVIKSDLEKNIELL